MNRTKSGVTWIELLVVIVILAVLVAILFPAIDGAEEAQRRSTCQQSLKRWGQAFSMYADEDPEQKYPPMYIVNKRKMQKNPESSACLDPLFLPRTDLLYPELIDDLAVLYCPSDADYDAHIDALADKPVDKMPKRSVLSGTDYLYFGWLFDSLNVDWDMQLTDFPVLCKLMSGMDSRVDFLKQKKSKIFHGNAQETGSEKIYVTPQFAAGMDVLFSSLYEGDNQQMSGKYFLEVADNDLCVLDSLGNNGSDTIHRLGKGVARFLITDQSDTNAIAQCEARIWTMMDAYGDTGNTAYFNHIPGGSNVLYMDGHVGFVRYVGSPFRESATPPLLPGMARIHDFLIRMRDGKYPALLK